MLSSSSGLTLGIVVLLALCVQLPANAQTEPRPIITIRVDSVLAADTHEGVDARLASISQRLKALFDYSTYRLVSREVSRTACGRMVAFNLPGGRILHVAPHRVDGDMIEMELMLFQGPRPLMTTDLKLMNHGTFFIGGPRYQQGMLIISIAAETPNQPGKTNGPAANVTVPEN
jgi:hypothetical protein